LKAGWSANLTSKWRIAGYCHRLLNGKSISPIVLVTHSGEDTSKELLLVSFGELLE
jgi:hypothetical protein